MAARREPVLRQEAVFLKALKERGIFNGPMIVGVMDFLEHMMLRFRKPEVMANMLGFAIMPIIREQITDILAGESLPFERFRRR